MEKYILVSFPETQDFMDKEEWSNCIYCEQIEDHDCPDDSYMIPESLYNKVYTLNLQK